MRKFQAFLVAIAVLAACKSVVAQDAYVMAGQSPDLTTWTQFAAWSINERAGFDVDYMGTAPSNTGHCSIPGSILFDIVPTTHPNYQYFSFATDPNSVEQSLLCLLNDTTPQRMWTVGFNPNLPLAPQYLRKVVLHGMGHALGGNGHTNNIYSVMYATMSAGSSEYLYTTTDVEWMLTSPQWAAIASPSYCHNELAPDNDLMIPEVVLSGTRTRALLDYVGVVGGYHTWGVNYTSTSPSPKGCTNNSQDGSGNIVLSDVRGMATSYSSATLQPWGGQWRLIGFAP